MLQRLWITLLLALAMVSLPLYAAAEVLIEHEERFLELVNEVRARPLEAAAGLGLDVEELLRSRPELQVLLADALPPLRSDERLKTAARRHAEDMVTAGYFSRTSLDGRSPGNRMVEAGYAPVLGVEGLGLLSFRNFIAPGKAVDTILARMLSLELTETPPEQWAILNPHAKDGAVALATGRVDLGQGAENAYLVVLDVGIGIESAFEFQLLETLNGLRSDPVSTLAALYPDGVLPPPFGNVQDFPPLRLPPFAREPLLDEAAHRRGEAILSENPAWFTGFDTSGEVVPRLADAGYGVLEAAEVTAFFWLEPGMSFDDLVRRAAVELLNAEWKRADFQGPAVFSLTFTEIGLATFPVFGDDGSVFLLVVFQFARPENPRVHLIGRVFCPAGAEADAPLVPCGEQLLAVHYGSDGLPADTALVDPFGAFRFELPAATLPFATTAIGIQGLDGVERLRRPIYLGNVNQQVILVLEP